MKLIIGCPVKERAWILPNWFDAIEEQGTVQEIVCVYSPSADETESMLKRENVTILYDLRSGRDVKEIDFHQWGNLERYEYMASLRNMLIDYALDNDADYFFSLDSDILLPPGALKYMLNHLAGHTGVVAPAVNMLMQQDTAWNTMSWVDQYHPNLAHRPVKHPKGGQVDVIMAAMLLDRKGLEARWTSHLQGEDVGFSVDAHYKKIPLWWLKDVHCQHIMRRY